MTRMATRTQVLDPNEPEPLAIAEAARVLREGGLVAFPTETVYGLGGRALDEASIARIFAAKGRPTQHPLIAHVLGEREAKALASEWGDAAAALAKAFWPGPLTLVVPRSSRVPASLAGGGPTVAVRAPANAIARRLLEALGEPIAAPSANRYQTLSPTTAGHVLRSLDGRVELVLDGGPCAAGIESTVVDVCGDVPRILRPGAVDPASLRRVVGPIEMATRDVTEDEPPRSPGMDARHYAPGAELHVIEGRARAVEVAIQHASRVPHVGLVLRGASTRDGNGDPGSERALPVRVQVVHLADEPTGYARALFATLHTLDEHGCEVIVVEAVPEDDTWWAVADRLERGSTPP